MDDSGNVIKRILCLPLVLAFTLLVFAGCSDSLSDLEEDVQKIEMTAEHLELVAIDSVYEFSYFRDVRTDVMYSLYREKAGYSGMGGLSVMYHADGTPLLYSEWLDLGYSADDGGGLDG